MYWSATMRDYVVYEARLELARLIFADFDRSVHRILAQPFLLKAKVGGKIRKHVPDYFLATDHGPVVIDVKPGHLLAKFSLLRDVRVIDLRPPGLQPSPGQQRLRCRRVPTARITLRWHAGAPLPNVNGWSASRRRGREVLGHRTAAAVASPALRAGRRIGL